jgi:hypothetical protein
MTTARHHARPAAPRWLAWQAAWRLAGALWRRGQAVLAGLVLLTMLSLVPQLVQAQQADDNDDPPARVGRIARIDGRVSLQARAGDEVVESPRNWPVTSGDLLTTGNDARAELRIGSTFVRLDEHTRLRVVRLDDTAIELHLQRGSIALRADSDTLAREITVSSSAGRFEPQGEGFFRIDAGAQPGATAWQSALGVEQPGGRFLLRPGQYAQLFDDGGWRLGQPVSDEFAHWAMAPDDPRTGDDGLVAADMTGAEDLRWYGDWHHADDWGMVWFPHDVGPAWAPYREGRWAWVAPWGWTWIDDAPWGFAPFHYGRWVMWRGHWGWMPGEARLRPVYAPALVAWVDQPVPGSRFGRALGWFPLGPREIFLPSYRSSVRHRELINQPYLRQPMPREERWRRDDELRRGGPAVYRWAEVDGARGVLPRSLFEQARRPIDTSDGRRRDDRMPRDALPRDWRDGRDPRGRREPWPPQREGREVGRDAGRPAGHDGRRDDRPGERRDDGRAGAAGGNTIEAIRISPALRDAIGNRTGSHGAAAAGTGNTPSADPRANPPSPASETRVTVNPALRRDAPAAAIPSTPAPAAATMPAPAASAAPARGDAPRGEARPDGRGDGRNGPRRGDERPGGAGNPVRETPRPAAPAPATAPSAAAPAAAQRPQAPAAPPVVKPTEPTPGGREPDPQRQGPNGAERQRRRGDEYR